MNPNWQQGYQNPQPTGYQQPLYAQQTGFLGQQQQQSSFQQRPPPPPIPSQQGQPPYSFLNAPPPQSQFRQTSSLQSQATGWAGAGQGMGSLQPQQTGWNGGGGGLIPQATGLMPQQTGFQGGGGMQPLMAQPTGFHDPRLQMMASSFMPMNTSSPYASSGVPIFQQPTLPASSLSASMNLMTQNKSIKTPKIPWVLTKDEKKNYDQIFRAWDQSGSGFISGEVAQEVFGQSGLSRDDMAKIWTLADIDNRGKLNIQEFHVAMGLIYRSLNGNDIPDVLPAELIPPSARDLDSSADFLKDLLRKDQNARSTYGDEIQPQGYGKNRSFNSSPAPASRKDGAAYKHDEDRGVKTYKSSSRHLDRSSVRTGAESAADDLSDIKRQLQNTSSMLDRSVADAESKDEEDERLEREMEDLRYRVKRINEDIEYISKGRRSSEKDEQRRKLERELLYLAHERLPEVEKKIEERDERKRREEREGIRARDKKNDRYGGRYGDDDRYDDRSSRDPDKGYLKGTFERDRSRDRSRDRDHDRSRDRDRRDRSRDRDEDYRSSNDRYGRRSPDRSTRSPPPKPDAPSHSLAAPPAPPKPSSTPTPASQNLTPEQRAAERRKLAEQKVQDRMRALGLAPAASEEAVDTSVQERLEREKKEAEEQSKKAEEARAEREKERNARLEAQRAERGEPPKPAPSPAKPTPASGKAAPPPPASRSAMKKAPPAPASKSAPAPPPPAPKAFAPAPAPEREEEDPEEVALRERQERLKKAAADRAARMAEIERQEEEERLAEEQFNARRSAFANKSAAKPATPVEPTPSPPSAPEPAAEAPRPTPSSTGSHNPFHRMGAGAQAASPAAASSPAASTGKSNPFFKNNAGASSTPPIAAPVAVKKPAYVPPPDDDDWDVIAENNNDSDSDDDYDTAKRRKAELAKALFGGINPPSTSASPAPESASPASAAPKNPMLAALGGGSAEPAARGGLFAAIQGGAKLKKAVTKDKSAPAVTGSVIGDAAPPSHISDVPRAISSPPAPRQSDPEPESNDFSAGNPNRQSVDWVQSLAAHGGVSQGASEAPSLPSQVEEEEEDESFPVIKVEDEQSEDPLEAVNFDISLKVRTVYSFEGQRAEDLAFGENVMIDAHPAKDPESPWTYGTLIRTRKAGWFPTSYVVEVTEITQAKALYSYTGSSDEELPFVEDDIITIVDKSDDSWWKAVRDGVVFLVPATYLELIEKNQARPREDARLGRASTTAEFLPPLPEPAFPQVLRAEPSPLTPSPDLSSDIPELSSSPAPSHHQNPDQTLNPLSPGASLPSTRRAPPPPQSRAANRASISSQLSVPPSPSLDRSNSSSSTSRGATEDDDEDESSLDDSDEQDGEASQRREAERLRVLEAAGLKIKIDAPGTARRQRRPPPSVPTRRPQSIVSLGSSSLDDVNRADRPLPTIPNSLNGSSATPAPPSPPAIQTEDAYDRYQAFLESQRNQPPPPLPVQRLLTPTSPPVLTSPELETSSTSGGLLSSGLSSLMSRIKTSSSGATPERARRPSSIVVSSPMSAANGTSSPSSSSVSKMGTPAQSNNWSSLVADEGILSSISDHERKRQEAMFEFIATEAAFVRDCQMLVEVFYGSLRTILNDKEQTVIFSNLDDILFTSTIFLSELEERQKSARLYINSIADILAQRIPSVDVFLPYCSYQGQAIKVLQTLREKNPTLSAQLATLREDPRTRSLDLSSYLLIPMQRVTRYPMLLKQILHYTEPDSPDVAQIEHAITQVESVLNRINSAIADREGAERLAELSEDLWIGEGRLDLAASTRFLGQRKLIREGVLMKAKGRKSLTIVLTNDLIVLIDPQGTLHRMPLPLNEIHLKDTSSTSSSTFQILPRYRGDAVSLKASGSRELKDWMVSIERARRECLEGERNWKA